MRSIQRDDGENSVLGRAMSLLTAFGPHDAELSLAELGRRTGVPKPTVHRLVVELDRWGIVERTPRGVRLGMRLFELGQLAPRQRGLREAALPFLNDLYQATRETVHLAVLDGVEVVYVEKLSARTGPLVPSLAGGRMPAYCTGVGKALLAFSPPEVLRAVVAAGLPRRTPHTIVMPGLLEREIEAVRRRGVAFEHEESTPGIVCAACPVLGENGRAVAAISITGWATALDTTRVSAAVRTAALGLSRQLSAGPRTARPGDR
ncbi:IclR family transcriptional regulator [Dactylosporangium sp. CA-092794]|uniref:IclR family transcriptional regulator n=1 Tax=Dactylosporangium sp. CA-092794 TaxID=3239929 RepID=UPI003D92AA73